MWSILERGRTVAGDQFNRWMVPPAALCIHLCIGMAYGFSVFWLPMTRLIGGDHSVEAPAEMTLLGKLVTTEYDWDKPSLGWIYTLFFVFLGGSAAWFGRWLEAVGPRAAGFAAACCWSGGLLVAALGVYSHQLWLVWLGAGGIGGIGLGLGYISPVSTLIKWFPDRRGMAAGLAIMGFGGGAMIGSPLADRLMKYFSSSTSPGVWQTFVVLAFLYFFYMMIGAFAYRIPKEGWRPDGWKFLHPEGDTQARHVPLDRACKTPQFVLLWLVLCLNVSAGIGLLGMASPLLQEVFGGRLIGEQLAFEQLDSQQLQQVASIAAGFTGLLSFFNIVGRFFWASLSDYLGRKATFASFFALGCIGYASIPSLGHFGNVALYVAVFCGILTMYGGGFATIPAYLADQFGTRMVGAIHGRLLTAWSVAGVFGPVLVNYLNAYQVRSGVAPARAYDTTMYLLATMLAVGFVCNALVKPVAAGLFQEDAKPRERELPESGEAEVNAGRHRRHYGRLPLVLFWMVVLCPMGWGVWITLSQALRFSLSVLWGDR
ncbi:MAG: OFA family MFS transporter [Pirellulaceae bacterium]